MCVMARFLAEIPRDWGEIDRPAKENRKLKEKNDRLKREMEEYKKRYPTTVGIKNGKTYFIIEEHPQKEKSTTNLGARQSYEKKKQTL